VHVLQRRARDERAAVRLEIDELVGRELRERLPDRPALHAEHLAQLRLRQLRAGREPMLEDRGADPLGDRFVAGGRGRGGFGLVHDLHRVMVLIVERT